MTDENQKPVRMTFNSTLVVVAPPPPGNLLTQTERASVWRQVWQDRSDAEHRAWRESPEGQKVLAEGEALRAKYAAGWVRFEAEGILPFSLKDKDAWEQSVEVNKDDRLSNGITLYAARWAHMMEAEMEQYGVSLPNCANRLSHEADLIGLSGAAFWCAVNVLEQVWEYGDGLRAALAQ